MQSSALDEEEEKMENTQIEENRSCSKSSSAVAAAAAVAATAAAAVCIHCWCITIKPFEGVWFVHDNDYCYHMLSQISYFQFAFYFLGVRCAQSCAYAPFNTCILKSEMCAYLWFVHNVFFYSFLFIIIQNHRMSHITIIVILS